MNGIILVYAGYFVYRSFHFNASVFFYNIFCKINAIFYIFLF